MISVKNLKFSYTKKPFIDNMSFDVKKGEIFGFLGPSGAGKSTLQKILTGLLTNYQGSVKVNGIEVVDGSLRALDTPYNLIMAKGASIIRYTYLEAGREKQQEVVINRTGEDELLQKLLKENRLLSIHSSEPTLNEIFLEITGRRLQ